MTIDFSSTPDDGPTTTESEGSMFAPTPSWERGKKRSGLARMFSGGATRVADEPRSFAAESDAPLETGVLAGDQRAYAFDPIGPAEASVADASVFETTAEPAFAGTPTYANVSARRKTNAAPVAIAAGIVLLGGLAATGWYMNQPHTAGVAQLTPGEVSTTTTDSAPIQAAQAATPQEALPGASASTAAAPARTSITTTTTRAAAPASVTHQTTTVARARPAARSAQDVTSDASTTAPVRPAQEAPQAAPTAPAPTPTAPLVLTLPPTQAAPVQVAPDTAAPAPTQTAPATAAPPETTPPPQ